MARLSEKTTDPAPPGELVQRRMPRRPRQHPRRGAETQAGQPKVARRNPDAEGFRLDREVERRRKGDRLSVDPGRDGSAGLDAQRLRAPRPARRVRGTNWRIDHDDPQLPAVERRTCPAHRPDDRRRRGCWRPTPPRDCGARVRARRRGAGPPVQTRSRAPPPQQSRAACAISRRGSRLAGPHRRRSRARRCSETGDCSRSPDRSLVPAQRRRRRARRRDRSARRRHRGRSGCAYRRGRTQTVSRGQPRPMPRPPEPITPRDAESVGATSRDSLDEILQTLTPRQGDWLDASFSR